MRATKTCVAAQRFQYDYLNDDITLFGEIDYSITNKLPIGLREAIASNKKILILINPPYAESGDTLGSEAKSKVATSILSKNMNGYGYATRELFTQFLFRISKEIPTATIAMFSTLKYVIAPNFEKFRQNWNALYLGGFIVHSRAFEGLSGDFPIGFLIWKTDHKSSIRYKIDGVTTEILDKKALPIGEKQFYNLPEGFSLNNWISRPRPNRISVVPLKNAVTPAVKTIDVRGRFWSDNAIGQMLCDSNDLQHAGQRTAIFSSGYSSPGAFFITEDNLWKVAVIFSVRRLIKPTWINDRDQFISPSDNLPKEFIDDCLIWMLFNSSNLTASANDLEWNGKKWSIINHFIPFSEVDVDAPERFESDFMVQYLAYKNLSPESLLVLAEGKKLWHAFFSHVDLRAVRDALKLNRSDVGWYQVRKALETRNASGDFLTVNFKPFKNAYESLSDKLKPQVYELGFLKI